MSAATSFDNIEFTDRYGGRRPNWLTACHDCDAMGCYPEWRGAVSDDGKMMIDAQSHEDAWEFVICETCNGTAVGPWYQPIARLPHWLWNGMKFTLRLTLNKDMGLPTWSAWKRFKTGVQCAFLGDLGLWKP